VTAGAWSDGSCRKSGGRDQPLGVRSGPKASAIRASSQAGPPSAWSALRRTWARARVRASRAALRGVSVPHRFARPVGLTEGKSEKEGGPEPGKEPETTRGLGAEFGRRDLGAEEGGENRGKGRMTNVAAFRKEAVTFPWRRSRRAPGSRIKANSPSTSSASSASRRGSSGRPQESNKSRKSLQETAERSPYHCPGAG
jgi:hypothetical protein